MTDDFLNDPTNQQRINAEALERARRAAVDPLIQNYEFYKAMKEAHARREIISEDTFRRLVVETFGVPENEITPEQRFNARYTLAKKYGAVEFAPGEAALKNAAALQPLRANKFVAAEGDLGALAIQMEASVRQMAGQPVGGMKAKRTESPQQRRRGRSVNKQEMAAFRKFANALKKHGTNFSDKKTRVKIGRYLDHGKVKVRMPSGWATWKPTPPNTWEEAAKDANRDHASHFRDIFRYKLTACRRERLLS